MRKLILTIIMSAACLTGILAQEAVYIYRNDGDFSAFLTEDIDSILFITVPVDSMGNLEYPLYPDTTAHYARKAIAPRASEAAVQAVYTHDGRVHYIPMNAVDSIGFTQPPVIFAGNVKVMDKNMWKYITKVDGMNLHFLPSLSKDMVPQQNEILLCTDPSCTYFNEGFAGRVKSVTTANDGYTVNCETVTDISDIFKQLIGVERVTNSNSHKRLPTRSEDDSEYDLGTFNLGFGLDYTRSGNNWDVTASGDIDGNIKGTIVYNFSDKIQKLELRMNHDWQASARLTADISQNFEEVTEGKTLFVKYFPIEFIPVFKFEISAHTFVEIEGNASLAYNIKSPKYNYQTSFTYLNGNIYQEDTKIDNEDEKDNYTQTATSIDLNGSCHVGGMARVSFGTMECFGAFLKSEAEVYVGPKLSGQFHFNTEQTDGTGYYNSIKDSKIWVDALAAHAKFKAEAKLNEEHHYTPEPARVELGTLFTKEWYLVPEFSHIDVTTDQNIAKLSCLASRDLIMPVQLGFELLDESGNNVEGRCYSSEEYQGSKKSYEFTSQFDGLLYGKTYNVRPLVKFMGLNLPATPTETFTTQESEKPLCPDNHHPHMIDLGLPSGKQWACCNVGAAAPGEYGGYYAWAELMEKDSYSWDNYTHFTPPEQDPNKPPTKYTYETDIKQNIEGTDYDAAHTTWSNGWHMPTKEEYEELMIYSSQRWTDNNGINGMMVTGRNGNKIFLPAAGFSKTHEQETGGYYWYGTFMEYMAGSNTLFRIKQFGSDTTKGIESCNGASIRAIKE